MCDGTHDFLDDAVSSLGADSTSGGYLIVSTGSRQSLGEVKVTSLAQLTQLRRRVTSILAEAEAELKKARG